MHACVNPFTANFSSLSEEDERLDSASKGLLDHLFAHNLSEISPIRIESGDFLRGIMAIVLQDPKVVSMLNEVCA